MKKKYFNLLIPGVLIILSAAIPSCKSNKETASNNVRKDPTNYVYYLDNSPATSLGNPEKAAAELLGSELTGQFISNTGDGNVYYSDDKDVTVRFQQDPKTGNFSFSKSLMTYMGNEKPQLPSMENASAIAMDYLKKLDLMPSDGSSLKLVHVGGLKSSSVINGDKRGEDIDKMRTVVFAREIDSVPVVGSGSKIVVQLGNNAELLGMIYRWKEVKKSNSKKFIPVAEQITETEAEGQVKERVSKEFGPNAGYQILKTKKILYDGNQGVLQPAYSIEVSVTANIGNQQETKYQYLYLIQAMKKSPEPISIANMAPEAKRAIGNADFNNQLPSDRKNSD